MDDALLQLTAGGILTVMVLKETFGFVSKQRNGKRQSSKSITPPVKCVCAETLLPYVRDGDGTPITVLQKEANKILERVATTLDKIATEVSRRD